MLLKKKNSSCIFAGCKTQDIVFKKNNKKIKNKKTKKGFQKAFHLIDNLPLLM